MDDNMDEDLIVLGAPAETQAAGGETSEATESTVEGHAAGGEDQVAQPGKEQADPAATTKSDAPKAEGDEDGEADRPKKRSGINRMQETIARQKAEIEALRSAAPAAGVDRAAAIEKEIGAPPKESDYEDYVAFEDAKADYRMAKALATQRITEREAQTSTRQTQARQEAMDAFHDRMDEAREKISDFDKVMAAAKDREVAPHVSELVVESEKGGLLSYYLGKNPDQLEKLNRMSPLQAAKAVGALEHRLTLAKPKTATAAPTPAKQVSGASKPSNADSDLDAWLAKQYG